MASIWIVDASVFLELLDVPGFNSNRASIHSEYEKRLERRDSFHLPMAAVVETGNHIVDVPNGAHRRRCAAEFCDRIQSTLDPRSAWVVVPMLRPDEFREWVQSFPDRATERISLVDSMLIQLWEKTRRRFHMSRVAIWSLDEKLVGYDTGSND